MAPGKDLVSAVLLIFAKYIHIASYLSTELTLSSIAIRRM